MSKEKINEAVGILLELEQDQDTPKNIKAKIRTAISSLSLNSNENLLVNINKSLQEFDDISNDPNIQPYIRTQILSIVSILESI